MGIIGGLELKTRSEYREVLTITQFKIIELLNAAKPNPVSKEILDELLDDCRSNSLAVTIHHIKKRLPQVIIKTHRSQGYSLELGGWPFDKKKCPECGQDLKK